jgi:hypothetical protein
MKNQSMWHKCGAHLTGTHSATKDTVAGKREGLREARALRDYRVNDLARRWGLKKAI